MDKENNNKLKKYKKKLTTKGRVDLSKGGRVKAAVGGIRKAPINRRRPPMSIQREEEPKELIVEDLLCLYKEKKSLKN